MSKAPTSFPPSPPRECSLQGETRAFRPRGLTITQWDTKHHKRDRDDGSDNNENADQE